MKIKDLKEGMSDVNVRGRVLEVRDPKIVQTRRGPKRISEAIVGDETGRVKLTLWGEHAGSLEEGEAVEISGAWTTSYRGEVQLNVGYKGNIERLNEDEVPGKEDIPEDVPKAEERFQRGGYRRDWAGRSYGGYRRQGYSR